MSVWGENIYEKYIYIYMRTGNNLFIEQTKTIL